MQNPKKLIIPVSAQSPVPGITGDIALTLALGSIAHKLDRFTIMHAMAMSAHTNEMTKLLCDNQKSTGGFIKEYNITVSQLISFPCLIT